MRRISATQFQEYMSNAWLSGMTMNEICRELICVHDIEVTSDMESAMVRFYTRRDNAFDCQTSAFTCELKGH